MERAEPPAVVYGEDPVVAAAMNKEYRLALKAAIAENTEPEVFRELTWTKAYYPALQDPSILRGLGGWGLERVSDRIKDVMFKDDQAATAMERGDGIMPGIQREGAEGGAAPALFSPAELAALWESEFAPSGLQQPTRASYWNSWRQVLTFGMAHEVMDQLLPMSVETLKAFTVELLLVGASANTVKNAWSAIEHRHRMAELSPPLVQHLAFQRLFKAVASIKGTPGSILFPIGTHHLKALFEKVGLSRTEERSVLVLGTGTTGCSRPVEVSNMQVCDLLWGHDAAFHVDLAGGLAIRIYKRKQDTGRYGLYVRVPDSPLARRLRRWVDALQLRLDPRCMKGTNSGGRCKYCDPVFPRLVTGRTGAARDQPEPLQPMSRQQVTGAVKTAVGLLGLDDRYYSGKSMRRGGITAAVQARVPEAILYLQSGHGTARAGRRYVDPVDPRILYATGAAILGTRPLD
jgi:hypothetical protein